MGSSQKDVHEFPNGRPAINPEEQENRLISLAVKQAEKQLQRGEAPTQVVTHYLKLATVREQRERERLRLENELLKAKTEQINAMAKSEEIAEKALIAFKSYTGNYEEVDDE